MNGTSDPWNNGVHGDQVLPLINVDAPVIRVEAGPGTGKTFGLTRRVLRLVHPDGAGVEGKKVLIVAFNRVIAADLRTNITSQLEAAAIDAAPEISTVHGLCQKLLGDNQRRMLLPHEVEAMLYDVRHQHDTFASWKFDELSQALRDAEAGHQDNHALVAAVRGWLTLHKAKLVGDLPNELVLALKGGDLADTRFTHVLVDEFQDLTASEQELVTRLVEDGGTLVALGDPRQSIYAFRGNDRLGLDSLGELTGSDVIDLPMTECQRCPGEVVSAANALMALEGAPMTVASQAEPNLHVVHWNSPTAEAKGMAKWVVDNWEQYPNDQHLVMVSRRKLGFLLRDEIKVLRDDVNVDLTFSESMLEEWPVREAFLFFCLLVDPDPAGWRGWLGYQDLPNPTKAPSRNADAYLRFLYACENHEIAIDDLFRLADEARGSHRGTGGSVVWDRAVRFLALLGEHEWNDMSAREVVEAVFDPTWWVPEETEGTVDGEEGKWDAALHDLGLLRRHAVDRILEEETQDVSLTAQEVLQRVARNLRYRIATREPFETGTEAKVQVTTLWGAKGLTAAHVYVMGVCDEAMPGERPESYPGSDAQFEAEQRRLFFVSITRTKRTMVISQLKRATRTQALVLGLRMSSTAWVQNLTTSRFLAPILGFLPDSVPGTEWKGCNPH